MFAWMNLSSGEISQKDVGFDETNPSQTVRSTNIPKNSIPVETTVAPPPPVVSPVPPVSTITPYQPTVSEVAKAPEPPIVPETITPEYTEPLPSAPEKIVMKIDALQMPSSSLLKDYKALLMSPKLEPLVTPIVLELVDDRVEPRGKMTTEMVSLVVPLNTESESLKVFAHELGLVVDIEYLLPGLILSDPSEAFYAISWIDMSTKKKGMALKDFVSGYAMTNKYEDFGESFNYYLFHNNDFVKRAKQSKILQAKYNFIQRRVFPNQEFVGTGFEMSPIQQYNWDTTKIPIALNKYLFYIK
jgi:hypothetical protein